MCLLVFGYTFQMQGTIFRIILMCIPQIPEIRRRSVLLLSNNIFQFKLIYEQFAKLYNKSAPYLRLYLR